MNNTGNTEQASGVSYDDIARLNALIRYSHIKVYMEQLKDVGVVCSIEPSPLWHHSIVVHTVNDTFTVPVSMPFVFQL